MALSGLLKTTHSLVSNSTSVYLLFCRSFLFLLYASVFSSTISRLYFLLLIFDLGRIHEGLWRSCIFFDGGESYLLLLLSLWMFK